MNNPNHKPNEATIKWLASLPEPDDSPVAKARAFWLRFLARPPEDDQEWCDAHTYAVDWSLCACGVSLPAELRVGGLDYTPPNDEALSLLGNEFATAVDFEDWHVACALFEEIQIREYELLKEMHQ